MAREAVIVEAVRTPLGRRGGSLKDVRLGCVTQIDEQGLTLARLAALVAGFPDSVPGTSVNRQCGSGQQAVNFAAQGILSGTHELLIAGGVESMTRVPMGSDAGVLNDRLLAKDEIVPQGISADYVARKYDAPPARMDEYADHSHMRAMRAIDEGRFRREIVPVPVKDGRGGGRGLDTEGHARPSR